MSKRWSTEDDLFLYEFFPAVGDYVGTHDLGRLAGAATKRVASLKASGAWEARDRRYAAELDYRRCTGRPCVEDGI